MNRERRTHVHSLLTNLRRIILILELAHLFAGGRVALPCVLIVGLPESLERFRVQASENSREFVI